MTERERLYRAIDAERLHQDARRGGPAHDDDHHPFDWLTIIERQGEDLATAWGKEDRDEVRRRFVKIAAVAVAALEAFGRTHPEHRCVICGGCRISLACCFTTCSCEDGP